MATLWGRGGSLPARSGRNPWVLPILLLAAATVGSMGALAAAAPDRSGAGLSPSSAAVFAAAAQMLERFLAVGLPALAGVALGAGLLLFRRVRPTPPPTVA